MSIKSIACEVPAKRGEPRSRLFVPDIHWVLIAEKQVESISYSTIWRVLEDDGIKPWRHRSWMWSRDPLFSQRAGQVLDLYERRWNGRRLRSDEFVISADEKTSIQARVRIHDPTAYPGCVSTSSSCRRGLGALLDYPAENGGFEKCGESASCGGTRFFSFICPQHAERVFRFVRIQVGIESAKGARTARPLSSRCECFFGKTEDGVQRVRSVERYATAGRKAQSER